MTPQLEGPTVDPLVGRHLGPYALEVPLGTGGMGTVYRAVHRELGQPRAIKVLATSSAADPAFVNRFRREARLSAGLLHPNIVRIHDFGEQDGLYYVAMELLPGHSLHHILRASGPLPVDRAIGLLQQLADALDYAHAQGVVHRDVKPANVIVDGDGHLTLVDFGISRAIDGTQLTRTGLLAGTPVYMAPEQVAGGQEGPNADRYALGVVAYELLTGRVPFEAPSTPALLYALVHTQPPPPRSFRASLPPALEGPILRQLAKEPEGRYPSAASFVAALATATARDAAPTVATTPPTIRPPLGPSDAPTAGLTRPTAAARDTRGASVTVPRSPSRLSRRRMLVGLGVAAVASAGVGPLVWNLAGRDGGAVPTAVLMPVGAPPSQVHRVGYLAPGRPGTRPEPLLSALRELGYVEGKNLTVDARTAATVDQFPRLAAELVSLGPDLIVTGGELATRAAMNASGTTAIVFTADEPIEAGLVTSLSHPGGRATGLSTFASELSAKRLELLRAVVPTLTRVAILWPPHVPDLARDFRATEEAAAVLGVDLQTLPVGGAADYERAFVAVRRGGAGALMVLASTAFLEDRAVILAYVVESRLPAIYSASVFVSNGGLLSYHAVHPWSRLAAYVDKILKGAKPAELPVEQPTTFNLAVNLRTARNLGLTIPPSVLQQATEVIQ